MRTLVPKSIWSCLSRPIPGSTHAEHKATLDQALAEQVKRGEGAVRQAHDWLCSNPLSWDSILWAHPPDSLSLFSVSHVAFSTSVLMPPGTRPTYQHPPPLPRHALKTPSKPGRPHHSQQSVARPETPNVHPATHRHKTAYGRNSAIRPPSLGRLPNAQKPPALPHPQAPEHATLKHAYLSALGLPPLSATHRLPLPVTAPLGTSEIFSVNLLTFCPLHLTPSTLCPFPSPPPPPSRVPQHSSNHTIRANTPFPWRAAPVMYYMLPVVYILS